MGLDCTCCHHVLVFSHVLPPIHASLVPSLIPTPIIAHPQTPLKPFFTWFSFNLHPSSEASIHQTSSHSVNDSPILAVFYPLSHNQVKAHERNMPLGAQTEDAPLPNSYILVYESSSCPHAATLEAGNLLPSLLDPNTLPQLQGQPPIYSQPDNPPSRPTSYPLFVGTKYQNIRLSPLICAEP